MSCYGFVDEFDQASNQEDKDIVLEKSLQCFALEENLRKEDFQEWMRDFTTSEEYKNYIDAKRRIYKESKGVQCDFDDIIVEVKEKYEKDLYPLTKQGKQLWAFKEQFKKYLAKKEKMDIVEKQKRGIQSIQKKINEAKKVFECTWERRQTKKNCEDQDLLTSYCLAHKMDLFQMSEAMEAKLLNKIKKFSSESNKPRIQENMVKILQKLVEEYQYNKQGPKKLEYRPIREKIIGDMEVVGTKSVLHSRDMPKIEEEAPPQAEEEPEPLPMKLKKSQPKQVIIAKVKKQEKIPKKGKSNAPKKKEKRQIPILAIPDFPVTNQHEKIVPENIDDLLRIVEECRKLDDTLENYFSEMEDKNVIGDAGIEVCPPVIYFQNYVEDESYTRKITLRNISYDIRKLRFEKFIFPNDYDTLLFKLDFFGIAKLYTGCSVSIKVNFQPNNRYLTYDGKIRILSYNIKSCVYYPLDIPIKCITAKSEIELSPETIRFGAIPVWKAKKSKQFRTLTVNYIDNVKPPPDFYHVATTYLDVNLKNVTRRRKQVWMRLYLRSILQFQISNKGKKPCVLKIKKIFDPLGIEKFLEEEESNQEENLLVPKNSRKSMREIYCLVGEVIRDCIRNIDNFFEFQCSWIDVHGLDDVYLPIFFKNISHVGDYFEKYTIEIYEEFDNDLRLIDSRELSIYAETTGNFLKTIPNYLDFQICIANSTYQLSFEVVNESKRAHSVAVKVPRYLSDLIKIEPERICVYPGARMKFLVKFTPSAEFTNKSNIYYTQSSSALEAAIKLVVVTKNIEPVPSISLPIYARLSNYDDLTIYTENKGHLDNFLQTIVMDLGSCTTCETIWTEIYLSNNTSCVQYCGLIDLPEAVTIMPNYGFCKLYPGQRKQFKLYISPEARDFPSFASGDLSNNKYFFKMTLDTIARLGRVSKVAPIDPERLKESVDLMNRELRAEDDDVVESMEVLSNHMKKLGPKLEAHFPDEARNLFEMSASAVTVQSDVTSHKSKESIGPMLDYENFLIYETQSRREIWCKVSLKKPLLEFSHQSVEFPDTPCGSYSTMEITLMAYENKLKEYGCKKNRVNLDYEAYFEFECSDGDIIIEPSCGRLRPGKSIKLTLVAKPTVPEKIVIESTKSMKYHEIYERRLQEFIENKNKRKIKENNKTGKQKGQKAKDGKKSLKTNGNKSAKIDTDGEEKEMLPEIIITDKDLEYDYLDLYPGEMSYWKTIQPYYIKSNFICNIRYENCPHGKSIRKPETLYLEASCKVIKPAFVTSLNQQSVDFGGCLVGSFKEQSIMIQNIQDKEIKLKLALVNPEENFSLRRIPIKSLGPGEVFEVPIKFQPTFEEKITEFFENKSGRTVVPIILSGQGLSPSITINPDHAVYRLETKINKVGELRWTINNYSAIPASVTFTKLFEIEATLDQIGSYEEKKKKVEEVEVEVLNQKKKSKNDAKTSKKSNKEKKKKLEKYSEALNVEEEKLISEVFKKVEDSSHFELKDHIVSIPENGHATAVLRCGNPSLINKAKAVTSKESKKNKTHTTDELPGKMPTTDKQYITQYNIHCGVYHLTSVVIICTIKH